MCSFVIGTAHNIIKVRKSRRITWVRHVAGVGQRRSALWVLVKERDYMEDLGVDGWIISRGIVKELEGESADWIIGLG